MTKRWFTIVGTLVIAAATPAAVWAQNRRGPLSEEEVVEMLHSSVLRGRVADLVARCGIDFDLNHETESDLRDAGLTDEQLETMWRADEARTVGSLRTLNTAEITYVQTYKKGYSASLAALGVPPEGAKPSAEAAGLIDSWLASGKAANNYTVVYTVTETDKNSFPVKYAISMRPIEWQDGRKSFYADQSGVIRWTVEDRAATEQDSPIGR